MDDTLFDPFHFVLKAPSPLRNMPYEEEVVNTSFQIERLFNYPYPWDRWFTAGINAHRRTKPVAPDYNAIRHACDIVGLRQVPQIYYNADYGLGTTFRPPGTPAIITFEYCLSALAASVILWHELRHAAQHEQSGYVTPTEPMPDWSFDPAGYWYHPDEMDARKYEKYGLDIPLVAEVHNYNPDILRIGF